MTPNDLTNLYGLDEQGRPPPLNPDLMLHLYEVDQIGLVLKHPLVFSVPYMPVTNKLINDQLAAKLKAIAEDEAEGKWAQTLVLWERPYRIDRFVEIMGKLTDREYWEELHWLWTDTENLWQNEQVWRELLTSSRRGRARHFMHEAERVVLANLPPTVTVWRGTPEEGVGSGMSWTRDRPRAEWFARRWAHRGSPVVAEGRVQKRRIIACIESRNEEEVIALPEDVDITGIIETEATE